jgi:hypothetical protein
VEVGQVSVRPGSAVTSVGGYGGSFVVFISVSVVSALENAVNHDRAVSKTRCCFLFSPGLGGRKKLSRLCCLTPAKLDEGAT